MMPQYRQLQITARLGLKEDRGCERMEEDMIEIICNKDESDKPAKKSKDSSVCIRRPKNIKQIGDVSSDKKIYIEDYAFTYINSIAYNNPEEEQAGVLLRQLTEHQQHEHQRVIALFGRRGTFLCCQKQRRDAGQAERHQFQR